MPATLRLTRLPRFFRPHLLCVFSPLRLCASALNSSRSPPPNPKSEIQHSEFAASSRFPCLTRLSRFSHLSTSALTRFLSILLLALAPLASPALTEGDYTYTTNAAGQATITDFNDSYSGALSITNTLGGCPVTAIGFRAFYGCTSLTSVTIPDSVTTIGYAAFYYCTSLTSATIPDSVTSIGDYAFVDCTSLTAVTIPSSVTSIGDWAFSDCYSLISVTIPSGVTSIGENAFRFCTSLTSVTIPDSVTSISQAAFSYCYSLTSVTIPDSVTSIGNNAFFNCSHLISVTIPDSVTSIGSGAFCRCYDLTSVTIPDSVISIGGAAFAGCTGLTNISVEAANPAYTSADGVLFNKDFTTLVQYPGGKTGSYTIPSCVTSIGYSAFNGCTSLTSITIPSRVTIIGDGAFYDCTSLTSVTIPDSVITIGDSAFCYCYDLTSVTIPDSVTSIGSTAFYSCNKLTSVVIPGSVTNIGDGAFQYCSRLKSVLLLGAAPAPERSSVFASTPATLYYLPAFAATWPATFADRPTLCWNPTIQRDTAFGFASDRFGFNLNGTPDIPVKVEATTNLASGVWTPVTNANLTSSGSLSFTDPTSTSLPARFYRIAFP